MIKKIFGKVLSILLIVFGLYHIIISSALIFFVYPKLLKSPETLPLDFQESLVEKAIILYLSTIIDGLYGMALLIKPSQEVKNIHLVAGLILFVFSIFFITRTQLITDPLGLILSTLFKAD
jgi:hypothetical protein